MVEGNQNTWWARMLRPESKWKELERSGELEGCLRSGTDAPDG